MGWILLLVILVGLFAPGPLENTGNSCGALDYQLIKFFVATLDPTNPERIKAERMSIKDLSTAVFGLPNGEASEKVMGRYYPGLPTFISCAVGYWRMRISPWDFTDELKAINQKLHNP
jgi:hypothetical protein